MTTPSISQELIDRKIRVYIVDDHPLVRSGLTALIHNESDIEVCGEAGNYATALREMVALVPDVAIVDLSLANGSGLELIKSIRSFTPRVRICVFSVHDEAVFGLRVLKAGAFGYVAKQDAADRVITAIRRLARGQRFMSDVVVSQLLEPLAGGSAPDLASTLSDRELEVMVLIGQGSTTREIAARLHVSMKTVESHRMRLKQKLKLQRGSELLQYCVQWVRSHSG